MKTRWKILIIVGVFLTVMAVVALLTAHIQPQHEVEAYKKLLRNQGEKLEVGEVLPLPVPAEQNGVDIIRSAFSSYTVDNDGWTNRPLAMRLIMPGRAIVGSIQPDVRGFDYTNTWENAAAAVAVDLPATELLNQAANYPILDFQLDYSKGIDLLLPHLAQLKQAAIKLSTAAMYELHDGNTASATTNLSAILALTQGVHDERTLISQLVRIAMVSIAASTSWELLQSTNVNEAELAVLQKNWTQLDFVKSMENAFVMERAMNETTIKKIRESNAEFQRVTGM